MSAVAMGADNARTVVFPKTVKTVQSCAFCGVVFLQSAVLNEGLLTIWNQAFQNSGLQKVVIPSTLLDLGKSAFAVCCSLARVDFREGSRLETIGDNCFCQTAVT